MDEMLKSLPSQNQRKNVQTIFDRMVEARQNCEQMIFRGHRLLDQASLTRDVARHACLCEHSPLHQLHTACVAPTNLLTAVLACKLAVARAPRGDCRPRQNTRPALQRRLRRRTATSRRLSFCERSWRMCCKCSSR